MTRRSAPRQERSSGAAEQPRWLHVRHATISDLDALVALDAECFPAGDRFSRRVWRHLLAASGSCLVRVVPSPGGAAVPAARLHAAAALLLRRGSRVARLYTLAVAPAARGQGLAKRLIQAIFAAAPRHCTIASLEVRHDNVGALALYRSLGFSGNTLVPHYYADGSPALRLRAPIALVR